MFYFLYFLPRDALQCKARLAITCRLSVCLWRWWIMTLYVEKVAISLKRVKIEEKLLWRAYRPRKSPTLFRFYWVAAIFLLPVSPPRLPRRPFLPYFCPYNPAIGTKWYKWIFKLQTISALSDCASRGHLCDSTAFLFTVLLYPISACMFL